MTVPNEERGSTMSIQMSISIAKDAARAGRRVAWFSSSRAATAKDFAIAGAYIAEGVTVVSVRGCERIKFPSGGELVFLSLSTGPITLRGRTFDAVFMPDNIADDSHIWEAIAPCLFASDGATLVVRPS